MTKRILGIDLGSYSIKIVRLDCGRQSPKFTLLDCEELILPIEEDNKDIHKNILLDLKSRGLLDAEIIAANFSAKAGQMRIMKTPFKESRKIDAVLLGLLETELPFETNDMIMSWHRFIDSSNNKNISDDLSSTIRIAFAKKDIIAESLAILNEAQIDPRFLYMSSLVPYELVRHAGINHFISEESFNASAMIDFGHNFINFCVFDHYGIRFSRSLMLGGIKLTEDISKAMSISFVEAQKLKHEEVDLLGDDNIINNLAKNHYYKIFNEITRMIISLKISDNIDIKSISIFGGGSGVNNIVPFAHNLLSPMDINIIDVGLAKYNIKPHFAVPFASALSCLQLHAKHSRFNFRKDEFTWRGGLDSLRARSHQLILWSLALVCSLVILWSSVSMVLKKENEDLNKRLKQVCSEILGQPSPGHKKCLAIMKEQINSSEETSIPDYTASDIFLKLAEVLPKEANMVITELDIMDKKVRIGADVPSFEDVDVLSSYLAKIPCFINLEKGNAQKKDKMVKVSFSADLDCNVKETSKKINPPK